MLAVVGPQKELVEAVGAVVDGLDDSAVPVAGGELRAEVEDAGEAGDLVCGATLGLLGDDVRLGGGLPHPDRSPAASAELFSFGRLSPADDPLTERGDFAERCPRHTEVGEPRLLSARTRNGDAQVVDVDQCAAVGAARDVGKTEYVGLVAVAVTEVNHGQIGRCVGHAELVAHCFSRWSELPVSGASSGT